jgi:hypothetical protein
MYTITVSAPGFKSTIRGNVELRVNDRLNVDVALELGATTETVTVTAETPLLDTVSASGGTTVSQQLVGTLPLLGSNTYAFMQLASGTSHLSAYPSQLSERPFDNGGMDGYAINGGLAGGNNNRYLLDGASNNNASGMGYVPPPSAVSEFKLMTNVYDAEYGKTGGGVSSVSLKSGANSLHGTLNYNFRNEKLNANLTQLNAVPQPDPATKAVRTRYYWQEPSVTVTGPVWLPKLYNGKDKTFFAFTWQELRDYFPSTQLRTFPTALEKSGNFSQTIGGNGKAIMIYDPTTTTCDASGVTCTRIPFTNSTIPDARQDPLIKGLMKYFMDPQTTQKRGTSNFTANNARRDRYDSFVVRVDQQISNNNKFFASFQRGNRHEYIANTGPSDPALKVAWPSSGTFRINNGAGFNLTTIFSPTLISTAKVNFLRYNGTGFFGDGKGFDPTSLGWSPRLADLFGAKNFPAFSASGFTGFGGGGNYSTTYDNNWSAGETLSKVSGSHSMKFGLETTATLRNPFATNQFPGLASFGVGFTQANYLQADSNSGDGLATALLGYVNGTTFTPAAQFSYGTHYYALFFQDDWKVSKSLSLNLGLRYDYQTPMTERFDRQVIGFDSSAVYTLGTMTLRGAPIWADKGHRSPYKADKNNFGPRFGITYSITRNMVFRGGWGVNYTQDFSNGATTGFSAQTSSVDNSPDGGRTPTLVPTASNPSSGLLANGGTSLFPASLGKPPMRVIAPPTLGGNISYFNPDRRTPYVHQFNAGFQLGLPFRSVLSVEYNGSRTRAVGVNRTINTVTRAQYLALGSKLTTTVANPFVGLLTGTGMNGATISLQQSLYPYPQFSGLSVNNNPLGSLWYNSLQARWEKRLSHGLTTLATFTWGKAMGQTDYMNPNYDDIGDLRSVIQATNQKLRLTISMSYALPFFKNGLSENPWVKGLVKQTLGGWTLAGTANFQSGSMFNTPSGVFSTGVDPMADTPYWKENTTLNRYFNTCTITTTGTRQNCLGADEPAAWIIQPANTLNNISPRFESMRHQRFPVGDVSVFKAFSIREGLKFELYGQVFNIGNTAWYGTGDFGASIQTGVTNASFGKVTFAQGNQPRIIQIAAKLTF